MSHFSVLVIGENPEAQLQPYHEFECTGTDDEFVKDVDITEEVRAKVKEFGLLEGLEWYGLNGDKVVASEAAVDRDETHKYGYAVVQDDVVIKAIDRTNPNKKWDWYQLGGRWTGYWKLRPGENGTTGEAGLRTNVAKSGYADAALKRQIDIDGMREEKGEKAREVYRRIKSFVGDAPHPESWAAVRTRLPNIEEARAFYNSQEFVKRMKEDDASFFLDAEDFCCTEEEYVRRARDAALVPFTILKDGQWYSRGEMGWWGCVIDEKDDADWTREANALLVTLPEDALLSVYDCHI